MASLPDGSREERNSLLGSQADSSQDTSGPGGNAAWISRFAEDEDPTDRRSETSSGGNAGYQHSEDVTHFSSISVDYCPKGGAEIFGGVAKIIERDLGGEDDFWSIHVNFSWRPRNSKSANVDGFAIDVSVDDLLTMRISRDTNPPEITIHLHGGAHLGIFRFPNGSDAAMEFVSALRKHVDTFLLEGDSSRGELYAIEKKQRMRQAAPPLMVDGDSSRRGDEFSGLLQDLNLRSASATHESRRREQQMPRGQRQNSPQDVGMTILSEFARVTQIVRNVGNDISTLLDESKRRAENDRRERERAARRRALDIYADIVASTDVERELPPKLILEEGRGKPVTLSVWNDSFGESGKLKDAVVMKQAIFSGGIAAGARRVIWPFVLGFYGWDTSENQREELLEKAKLSYETLKGKWQSLQSSAKEEDAKSIAEDPQALSIDRRKRVSEPNAVYLEIEEQIGKDTVRTDRNLDLYAQDDAPATLFMGVLLNVYAIYDNSTTYCQGMSDFLSPIIHVLGTEDEALTFWCFEALMQLVERNFRVDQSGMRAQLGKLKSLLEIADRELANFFQDADPDYYCCFRWILVRFKRELPFDSTAKLWEVLWTRQVAGDDFHVFVAGALLISHRRHLLSLQRGAFDCLLRYVNDMSMRIDVDFALREGELCFRKYGKMVR